MRALVDRLRQHTLTMAVLPLAVLLSACSATGMGWIPSNDPTSKATFGFSYDGTTTTFSGSYHDPRGQILDVLGGSVQTTADVDFKGTGKMRPCTPSDPACRTAPAAKGGCLVGEPAYQSQNRLRPGSGTFFLLVCDLDGNGLTAEADSIFLAVDSGPYTGYRNEGNPSGNITVKG